MKFIGLPKTVKKKNEVVRSVFGAFLLVSLIVVCVLGAESLFTASRTTTSASEAAIATAAPTPAATELAPLDIDATTPSIGSRSGDTAVLPAEITPTPTSTPSAAPTAAASPSPAPAKATETAESGHYYVTAELTIRSGPGKEFDKVGSYQAGDEIDTIASTSNGWKKIAAGQYVIKDYLSTTPPETELSGTYYAIGEINVRSGPGTEYEITKTLAQGDAITVVFVTTTGWYRTAKGTYVRADMCTSTPPATPTPTPTPRPTPTPKPTPTPTPAPGSLSYVGEFKITYYGPTGHSTYTGTECTEGRTIAVDPSVIPLGSKVYIEGITIGGDGYFIAEDIGGDIQNNWIDIYADDGESSSYTTKFNINVYIVN